MSAKEQYQEFLTWLAAKREEIVREYRYVGHETQQRYRILLITIQSEIWEYEAKLRRLQRV